MSSGSRPWTEAEMNSHSPGLRLRLLPPIRASPKAPAYRTAGGAVGRGPLRLTVYVYVAAHPLDTYAVPLALTVMTSQNR